MAPDEFDSRAKPGEDVAAAPEDPYADEIAHGIKEARSYLERKLQRRVSQAAFAQMLSGKLGRGVSASEINQWEQGKRQPLAKVWLAVEDLIGLSMSTLRRESPLERHRRDVEGEIRELQRMSALMLQRVDQLLGQSPTAEDLRGQMEEALAKGLPPIKPPLTDEQVDEIRQLACDFDEEGRRRYPNWMLAKEYQRSEAMISRILSGEKRAAAGGRT